MRATGAGSLPGDDFRGALGFVLETLRDLAPLPELPGRGPGADMVGRAAALLVDLPTQLTPQGWELSEHPGVDHRRAAALWRNDLDDLEELAQGFTGVIKVGIAGPWTLAALLGRPRAEVALADPGARRDVAQALLAGVDGLLVDLRRRLPEARFVLQLDEPMLPAVMGGDVRVASGFRTLRSIEAPEVVERLRPFGEGAVLHCCAGTGWLTVADRAGFAGVYADLTRPSAAALDALGPWLESGRHVIAGVLDSADIDATPHPDQIVGATLDLVERLGIDPGVIDERLLLAPACGLAGWSRPAAADAMRACVRAAELVTERLH